MHNPHQIISESESNELALDSYVMHIHNHHCAACGATEQFSQIYEVWLHPTKTRSSNYRVLRTLTDSRLKPIPFRYLEAPHSIVPICSDCVANYKAPSAPPVEAVTQGQWEATLRRKYEPAKPETKITTRTTAPRAVPTLDQL